MSIAPKLLYSSCDVCYFAVALAKGRRKIGAEPSDPFGLAHAVLAVYELFYALSMLLAVLGKGMDHFKPYCPTHACCNPAPGLSIL